jgi:energy-converting hydrogenase Eha subunit F
MKTTLLLLCLALSSCTLPYTWGANPLDRPGDEKSAATLHEENIQAITSNPGYRLAE